MQISSIRIRALAVALAAAATWTTPARADVSPEELRGLYDKLLDLSVDEGRQLDAAGRVLVREDLTAEFSVGTLHPIVRSDGRIVGVVFVGATGMDSARFTFEPPDDIERGQLERFADSAPFVQGFSAAWILATDDSLDQLVGDEEWTVRDDAADEARNLHLKRFQLYHDPLWDDWGPSLEMDVIEDLFGAGFAGGYTFAEFRTAPGSWVTYYRNPRGALLPTEEVSFFTHAPHGDAPQELHVFSSYDTDDEYGETAPVYDLLTVDLDVTVPKGGADRNLGEIEVVAHLQVQARSQGVRGIQLELQGRSRRTFGDEEWAEFDVRSVHAADGTSLSAIQDRNRLFVLLPNSLAREETTTLTVTYGGYLIQPCGTQSYSPLRAFAWYPRAPWPDHHTFSTTIHLPRALQAAATGALLEETVDKKVRTATFRESGDVLWGTLVIGEYMAHTVEHEGLPIRLLYAPGHGQDRERILQHVQAVLGYNQALWGDYPFDTLHVVDSSSLCSGGLMTGLTTGWLYAHGRDLRGTSGMVPMNMGTGTPLDALCRSMARQWWGNVVVPASYRERWIVSAAAGSTARLFMANHVSRPEYVQLNKRTEDRAFHATPPAPLICGVRSEKYFVQAAARGSATMEMLLTQLGGDAWAQLMREVMVRAPESGITYEGFRGEAARYLGDVAEPFFVYWVEGLTEPGVRCAYAVAQDEDGSFSVTGTLTFDTPPPPNAIPLEIKYSRKDSVFKGVVPAGEVTPFEITGLPKKPKSVSVDPENRILLRSRKSSASN